MLGLVGIIHSRKKLTILKRMQKRFTGVILAMKSFSYLQKVIFYMNLHRIGDQENLTARFNVKKVRSSTLHLKNKLEYSFHNQSFGNAEELKDSGSHAQMAKALCPANVNHKVRWKDRPYHEQEQKTKGRDVYLMFIETLSGANYLSNATQELSKYQGLKLKS